MLAAVGVSDTFHGVADHHGELRRQGARLGWRTVYGTGRSSCTKVRSTRHAPTAARPSASAAPPRGEDEAPSSSRSRLGESDRLSIESLIRHMLSRPGGSGRFVAVVSVHGRAAGSIARRSRLLLPGRCRDGEPGDCRRTAGALGARGARNRLGAALLPSRYPAATRPCGTIARTAPAVDAATPRCAALATRDARGTPVGLGLVRRPAAHAARVCTETRSGSLPATAIGGHHSPVPFVSQYELSTWRTP